ncbi:MAG: polysaccharide pyruvyl transferase family protein [Bacteroidota bacterium]
MHRRQLITNLGLTTAGIVLAGNLASFLRKSSSKSLLLVSGWQTVNIGDIAHTPGMIHLLKTHFPELNITLWPNDIDLQEEKSLLAYFPDLKIVKDDFALTGTAGSKEADKVMEEADFMLHGSGPGIVGLQKLQIWRERSDKPYGIFGVTIGSVWVELKEVLNGASFIFTRETHSLKVLQEDGVTGPATGFGPDATFFLPNRNDASAQFYMENRKLEDRKFICVVPRSRFTPYHRVHVRINWSREQTDRVIAENLKYAEEDFSKLREVIIRYVTETGNKVVLCPEMEYQTELYEPYLYNPLPSEIKDHILMHPYWQPDDAASLYTRAAAVVSMECHSPIISLVNGTPAIYVRQPSDTIKGQMYYDLELSDWIFEIEETSGEQIAAKLMDIIHSYPESLEKVKHLNQRVKSIYEKRMAEMGDILYAIE